MDTSRRSGLAGGLILILVGGAFLAAQFVPGLRSWFGAENSWPLIVVGVGIGPRHAPTHRPQAGLVEAEQLIVKALQLSPDDPFIIDSMGWVLYRKGDNTGALTHLQRAFSIRPDPEIAAHLGEVLWVAGRRDEAKKTWQEAAKAHPGNEVLAEVIKRFSP